MNERGVSPAGSLLTGDFPTEPDLLCFNARGTRLAVTSEGADRVLVFDPHAGREVARLTGLGRVRTLQFLSPEVLLVTHGGVCTRWDLRTRTRANLWEEKDGGEYSALVSPNGRVLAVGGPIDMALYSVARQSLLRRVQSRLIVPTHPVAFSPGGRYLAARHWVAESRTSLLLIWDAHTGRRLRTFEDSAEWVFAFRGDTLTLATSDGGTVRLYEPDGGEDPVMTYALGGAVAVRFAEGERTLEALLGDGSVVRLQGRRRRVLRRPSHPAAVELSYKRASADWSLLAGASRDGVFVWTADGG